MIISKTNKVKSNKVKTFYPVCRHMGVYATSAVDGRPRYICDKCGHSWTSGKKPGQGYKDWPK